MGKEEEAKSSDVMSAMSPQEQFVELMKQAAIDRKRVDEDRKRADDDRERADDRFERLISRQNVFEDEKKN